MKNVALAVLWTALLIAFFYIPSLYIYEIFFGGPMNYPPRLIEEVRSPNGAWKAQVVETIGESPFASDIVAGVSIISTTDPKRTADILGVDTSGHDDEQPRVAWIAPNVLRVTVPNLSYLKVLTRDFEEVHVDLRYDPDDAVARAAWRRRLGEKPDVDAPD